MELIDSLIRSTIFLGLIMVVISLASIIIFHLKERNAFKRKYAFLIVPILLFIILLVFKTKYIDLFFEYIFFIEAFLLLMSLFFSVSLIMFIRISKNAPLWSFLVFLFALSSVGYFHLQNSILFKNIHIGESRGTTLSYMSIWGSVFSFVGFLLVYLIIVFIKRRD